MLCHLFTCFSATALRNWKIWQMTTCWAIRAGKPHGQKKKPSPFWPVYNCNKLWRLPLGNKTIKNSHEFLPYVFISFILFTVHKRNMFCGEIFWNISLKVKCECKDNQNLSTLHNSREISRYSIYKLKAARTYK